MISEFDRIDLSRRGVTEGTIEAPDTLAGASQGIDNIHPDLIPPPLPKDEDEAQAPTPADVKKGIPAPPKDPKGREEYFKKHLGIRQALLLLEDKFPSAHQLASRGIAISIDPSNRSFARGDSSPDFTIADLLRRAAGHPDATFIDPIADYFERLSSEEREVFHPDYQPTHEASEPDGAFPVRALPSVAREVVNQMVELHNVPPELPASMVLAVASASLARGLAVKSVHGLTTYGNIYVIGGGATGAGKSITANPIIKPLRDFEAHLKAQHKKSLPSVMARLTAIRSQLEGLQNGEPPTVGERGPKVAAEEKLRTEEAALLDRLVEPTLIVDDATSEAMAKLAGQNNGTIASLSSDARTAIKNLIGKHAKGNATDEDILLKGFSNESIIQDRITRDRVSTVACFTVAWITQPDNMYALFDKDALADSGLLCRVLPFIFEGRRPPANYEEVEFPPAVSSAFHDRIWELATTYHQHRGDPHLISATPAARKLLIDYDSHIRDLIDNRDLKWIATFAVRLGEQAWRIALVLHALEHGNVAHNRNLGVQSAKGAVEIVKWFFRQVEALFGTMVDNKADQQMAAAREFVDRHPEGVTAREVQRFKQGLFASTDDARSTLKALVAEEGIRAGDAGRSQRFYPRKKPKS